MTDAFDKVTFRGHLMDKKTQAFLEAMESKLGYELTVLQGCYNAGGVAASGGTHDGGGVVDLAPFDAAHKVKVARALGAFAWHRPTLPGVWNEHIHLGIRDHGALSAAARSQQVDYDATPPRNGLANHAPDQTWHPKPPVTFKYPPKIKAPTRGKYVAEAIAALRQAKGGPKRTAAVKAALKALLGIKPR